MHYQTICLLDVETCNCDGLCNWILCESSI